MNLLARSAFDRAAWMVGAEPAPRKLLPIASLDLPTRREDCAHFTACSEILASPRTDLPNDWHCPTVCPDYTPEGSR